MVALKVLFVLTVMSSMVASLTMTKTPQDLPPKGEQMVRSKRFLFNSFLPIQRGFNLFNEDDQVRVLQQQRRVLERANAGFNQFSNDDVYVQALLQQRRVRQRYFEETGERLYSDRGYYNGDNYNNNRFRN